MTRIKLCGLSRPEDIEAANTLCPDYIGFVFAKKSRRYITPEAAGALKKLLRPEVSTVGVFVNETPEAVAELLESGVIDIAQLHGDEDDAYIAKLRTLTKKPLIQAFRIREAADAERAEKSPAEEILLDAGAGTGTVFDWDLLKAVQRPFFLAGGLGPENAGEAVRRVRPYGVDVSSGIETDGKKDPQKMAAFVAAVREETIP